MTHEQAVERLDDFASGELPDIERVMVQRHVDGCPACQEEVEAIRSLLAMAVALPAGIAPRRDLWAGIAPRLEPRAASADITPHETTVIPLAPRRRRWQPPRWALQAAAAVVLVASSSAVTAVLMRRQAPANGPVAIAPVQATRPPQAGSTGETTQVVSNPRSPDQTTGQAGTPQASGGQPVTAFAAFRPAERDYQQAIDDLTRVLEMKRGEMAPETVTMLETNLRIIDQAIAESRAALAKDPNSRELTQMLSASYDAKVQALRQVVEL